MTLNTSKGLHVFRNVYDIVTLVAYRRIDKKYMIAHYTGGDLCVGLVTFDDILDSIPIFSIKLYAHLPMEDTLEDTLTAWKNDILLSLHQYGAL